MVCYDVFWSGQFRGSLIGVLIKNCLYEFFVKMYVKRNRDKLTFSHIKGKILTVIHNL